MTDNWYVTHDWPQDLWGDPEHQWHGPLTEQEQFWADQIDAQNAEFGYDTPEYRAWEEAQYAEHIGAATELRRCYLCYLEATGCPDNTPNADRGPLRGVVRTGSVRTHPTHPEADVYATVTLTCGHTLI